MRSAKFAALLLTMSMAASVAACSSEDTKETTAVQGGNAETQADSGETTVEAGGVAKSSNSSLGFKTAGKELKINMDFSEVSDALGEPASYFEAQSCAFQGLDKVYTYTDFVVRTYPDGDIDRISSIELKDDIVTTSEGAYIGMTGDEVKGSYSAFTVEGDADTSMTVVDGDTKLSFIFKDGTVDSITYTAAE